MKFTEIASYDVIINNNPSKDKQDVIILQQKGDFNFIEGVYSFHKEILLFKNNHNSLAFKDFPKRLFELIKKDLAQLMILEISEDFSETMKGNVFYPVFDLDKTMPIWKDKKKE